MYWSTRDPEFKLQLQGVSAAPLDSDFGRDKWTQLNPDGPILKPELPWEGRCIEAAAMARREGRLYMFYAGSYNNAPQQVGVAVHTAVSSRSQREAQLHVRLLTDELRPGAPDAQGVGFDDDRLQLHPDEQVQHKSVRFRTLGCYPLTAAVESTADTLPEIIQEMLLTRTSERQGRLIDHDQAGSMEKKKQEGYF